MVSSTGAGSGKPARLSTIRSNLAFCRIFSTVGSASSGPRMAMASASLSCAVSSSCPSGT